MLYHKFHAIPTEYRGIRFASKKEATYAAELDLRVRAGEVLFYLRQVSFDLPGAIAYRCDFEVFEANGSVHFIDVKGVRTKEFVRNKKMVEALFPVMIEEA